MRFSIPWIRYLWAFSPLSILRYQSCRCHNAPLPFGLHQLVFFSYSPKWIRPFTWRKRYLHRLSFRIPSFTLNYICQSVLNRAISGFLPLFCPSHFWSDFLVLSPRCLGIVYPSFHRSFFLVLKKLLLLFYLKACPSRVWSSGRNQAFQGHLVNFWLSLLSFRRSLGLERCP